MVDVSEVFRIARIGLDNSKKKHNLKKNNSRRFTMGHLKDVGMGYFEHMIGAYKLAFRFALGTLQLLIHGLIPGIFVDAGKNASDAYKR